MYTASNPFSKTECKFSSNKSAALVHLHSGCKLVSFIKIGAVTMLTFMATKRKISAFLAKRIKHNKNLIFGFKSDYI